ncbi:MAG: general secretion pathway protein M [Halioglobus sp.]|jgi:general secretion pathway protein M
MNWLKNHRGFAFIVGATLALPLLLVMYILLDFLVARQGYQSEIDGLQPRVARMVGLIESEEQLRASAGQLGSQVLNLVYPPTDDSATVSAALQADMRQIMTDAGLSVTNSRILPVLQEENFDRIGLSLTVSGGLDALDSALLAMADYKPLLLIDTMDIKPKRMSRSRGDDGQQIVIASFQLLTLKAI